MRLFFPAMCCWFCRWISVAWWNKAFSIAAGTSSCSGPPPDSLQTRVSSWFRSVWSLTVQHAAKLWKCGYSSREEITVFMACSGTCSMALVFLTYLDSFFRYAAGCYQKACSDGMCRLDGEKCLVSTEPLLLQIRSLMLQNDSALSKTRPAAIENHRKVNFRPKNSCFWGVRTRLVSWTLNRIFV